MRGNRFNRNSELELRLAFLNTGKPKNGPTTNIHELVRKTQSRVCDMSILRLKIVAHEEEGTVLGVNQQWENRRQNKQSGVDVGSRDECGT
jgi:hypothetical protein